MWICLNVLFLCFVTLCFDLQILAVLAAVTEVIKNREGKESEIEYFAALVCISLFYLFIGW